MLTPVELKNRQFKPGKGYSREEMDDFLDELFASYEILYNENADLKEKINKLNDGVQYYKSMETALQKALVLAEKTSSETIDAAKANAAEIEKEANEKAELIITKAIDKRNELMDKSISLNENYKLFKEQYKQIALKQLELLDSDYYEIDIDIIDESFDKYSSADTIIYEPVTDAATADDIEPVSDVEPDVDPDVDESPATPDESDLTDNYNNIQE